MGAMKEEYRKLHKVDEHGIRGTTYYRTALFQDICSSSAAHNCPNISKRGVDFFFSNEPARLALEEFQKVKVEAQDDMSCLTLAHLDALINSMIDSFETFG